MEQYVKDSWNADLYDGNHSFVSSFGNHLLELLSPVEGEQILDVGCGTGDLAHQINQHGAAVTGVDKSENMVHKANDKYPDIMFMPKDVLELEYNNDFDAVFSNATLHWVKQPKEALQHIYNSLKPGGRFVAEFGGKSNVQTITNEIIHQVKKAGIPYTPEQFPWYFPSIGEYAALMEETGFNVTFAQHFNRPTPLEGDNGLRNWMEMFCGNIFENHPEAIKERVMIQVENNLKDALYQEGQWIADYKRLRVVGIKQGGIPAK
ncbi:class I SAM-dependent methyltransferase [Oceanobacillus sp. M60]|uniref:Trans-aconitate 2-methyltransferase n=1 Tax=Oceanobacillus oncorhynchi TaxID=545501 RepID=A0A0A1MFH7_9BACI|nr:class I SAM-dependent methyltransferase [Oceanobacillus oncorhynchi]CEI81808.1 Trans-aconitate 2-methyltransferase [Oceanobacillus oncorhynchi]